MTSRRKSKTRTNLQHDRRRSRPLCKTIRGLVFVSLVFSAAMAVAQESGSPRAATTNLAGLTLLSQQIVKDMEVSASVYNLFDTTYGYPSAENHLQNVIEQDG